MTSTRRLCVVFLIGFFGLGSIAVAQQLKRPNVLVLIGDDIGVEQLSVFDIGSNPAVTPNLDTLAARGMRFSYVWAQPLCSPTRATLLTGRYGFRTGVGTGVRGPGVDGPYPDEPPPYSTALEEFHEDLSSVIPIIQAFNGRPELPTVARGLGPDELALPALLGESAGGGYSTAALGKWHLADLENGWLRHPARTGFDHYSVLMKNEPESFFSWWENVNGMLESRIGYTPSRKVDDAIVWLDEQESGPWFLWLAFNLAHYPHHVPEVGKIETAKISPLDSRAALDVMIARLDQEIGRLFDAISDETLENTIVIFVGDNGTTGRSIDPPFHPDRAKFTLYEGGLRVPIIIAGPGVPEGESSDALVNTTDLFSTILELASVNAPEGRTLDSISLVPYFSDPGRPSIRRWVYADHFVTDQGVRSGGYAIRDSRYKLIQIRQQTELYDLVTDPFESIDLLSDGASVAERIVIDQLQAIADTLHEGEYQQ